jgi:hypothetical protein
MHLGLYIQINLHQYREGRRKWQSRSHLDLADLLGACARWQPSQDQIDCSEL